VRRIAELCELNGVRCALSNTAAAGRRAAAGISRRARRNLLSASRRVRGESPAIRSSTVSEQRRDHVPEGAGWGQFGSFEKGKGKRIRIKMASQSIGVAAAIDQCH